MDIPKIKFLQAWFDPASEKANTTEIFRKYIISEASKQEIKLNYFHQRTDDNKFRPDYPLIQYRYTKKRFVILALGEAVQEFMLFLGKYNGIYTQNGLKQKLFSVGVWEKDFKFNIKRWIALNNDNEDEYNNITDLSGKISFLEKILKGQLVAFADGLGLKPEKQVQCKLINIDKLNLIHVNKHNTLCLDAVFSTNLLLPNHVGIGKAVSKGYGVVQQLKENDGNE